MPNGKLVYKVSSIFYESAEIGLKRRLLKKCCGNGIA